MPGIRGWDRFVVGLLVLTASTGAIDAVSYLALDHVFTGNMTGNILFIGFAIVGVTGIPFLNNAIALLGFVAGTIVSGRIIGRGHPRGLPVRSLWVLVSGGVLAFALTATWLTLGELPAPVLLSVTFLLASVMGAQATAVKPIGNSDITTIVVTNTLANLARDSRLAGGRAEAWLPRLLALIAMGIGAATGALIIKSFGGPWAFLAAIVIYASGVIVLVIADRGQNL